MVRGLIPECICSSMVLMGVATMAVDQFIIMHNNDAMKLHHCYPSMHSYIRGVQ